MHNLMKNEETGKYAFVNNIKHIENRAWHHLGQEVDHAMTSAEAIKEAQLDYDVIESPVYTIYRDKKINISNRKALFNNQNNELLAEVNKGYNVVQNRDAFLFFDSIVGDKKAIFETAGALGNGEKIFITAKLPGHIKVMGDDILEKYLFLTNSHDGSSAIIAAFTPIRIVCNNTLNAALRNCSNRVYIKHTKNVAVRLEEAHKIMKMSDNMTKNFGEVCQEMAKTKISDKQLQEFIVQVMNSRAEAIYKEDFEEEFSTRTLNLSNEIFEYAKTNETQLMVSTEGTLFGAYNAITGYFQNLKKWKSPEEKLDKIILKDSSTVRTKTQKAFDLALSMI